MLRSGARRRPISNAIEGLDVRFVGGGRRARRFNLQKVLSGRRRLRADSNQNCHESEQHRPAAGQIHSVIWGDGRCCQGELLGSGVFGRSVGPCSTVSVAPTS